MPSMTLEPPSAQALLIVPQFGDEPLATATGFLVDSPSGLALITARHVVTGRHHDTDEILSKQTAGIPDRLEVHYNGGTDDDPSISRVVRRTELLFADGARRWVEHPTLGPKADICALPVLNNPQIAPFPIQFDATETTDRPADRVSVVGYPFGMTGPAQFPIWATGFIACELGAGYKGLPLFFIDCRSRQGQSGAPVFAHWGVEPLDLGSGKQFPISKRMYRFLGVYVGRVNEESDIGIVWKASAVRELVDAMRSTGSRTSGAAGLDSPVDDPSVS